MMIITDSLLHVHSFSLYTSLADIQSSLIMPSHTWTNQSKSPVAEIKLCKLGERTRSCGIDGAVILTFTVKSDRCWTFNVHGKCLAPSQCSAIKHQLVTTDNVNDMLRCLDTLNVCPAHPKERFVQMAKDN